MINNKKIKSLLDQIDYTHTECDGFVRLAKAILDKYQVPHQIMMGSVSSPKDNISLHFWVEIEGYIADYRAKMWLRNDVDVPHGVFHQPEGYIYNGESVDIGITTPLLFFILSGRSLDEF